MRLEKVAPTIITTILNENFFRPELRAGSNRTHLIALDSSHLRTIEQIPN